MIYGPEKWGGKDQLREERLEYAMSGRRAKVVPFTEVSNFRVFYPDIVSDELQSYALVIPESRLAFILVEGAMLYFRNALKQVSAIPVVYDESTNYVHSLSFMNGQLVSAFGMNGNCIFVFMGHPLDGLLYEGESEYLNQPFYFFVEFEAVAVN